MSLVLSAAPANNVRNAVSQLRHDRERLHPFHLMREYRSGSGSQTERDFPPVHELGHRGERHGQIDRVAKVGHRNRGPKFDRQSRHDRRRARQHAAIFQIVIGPNLAESELFHGPPSRLGEPDQFRQRVTIEDMKRIVNADFTAKFLFLFRHGAPTILARALKCKTILHCSFECHQNSTIRLSQSDFVTMGCADSHRAIRQDFAVADAQRFNPTLLAEGQRDEETELDEFGNREMAVQLFPKRFVGNVRIPDNRAGVCESRLLALGEFL